MWFLGVVSVPDLARPSNHHPIGFTNLVRCSYSRMNPKLPKPTSGNHLKPQISMSIGTALRWWPLNLMGCLNLPAKSLGDWPSGRVAEPKPTVGQTWTKSKSAQAQRAPSPASLPLRPPNHPCRKEELKNGEKWWENDGKCIFSQQFECSAKKKAPVFAIQPFSAMTVHKHVRAAAGSMAASGIVRLQNIKDGKSMRLQDYVETCFPPIKANLWHKLGTYRLPK